ncbi:hypothetical protein R1flu_028227 [Riccia fluitans]|uniref:Uncharacterized protein n=1 Tax=Riccia fluitans TaxID=41844 RepID=A0ABD1XL27_9MARC
MTYFSGSSNSATTSCCDGEENVVSDMGSWVCYTKCPVDNSASCSVASSPEVREYDHKKNGETAPPKMDYRGEDCLERERGGECEYLERQMNLARIEVYEDSEVKAASKRLRRTDSSCSSNRPSESSSSFLSTRSNQLFRQLQKLRIQFLADLWEILGKFKVRLDDYLHDASVRLIVQQHIDILQRMIAPMVAQKQRLESWLTEEILHQLRGQIVRYLDAFRGEKFQSSFNRLIVARPGQADVWFVHPKTESGRDYQKPAAAGESSKSDDDDFVMINSLEDRETCTDSDARVEQSVKPRTNRSSEEDTLKRKGTSNRSKARAPGSSVKSEERAPRHVTSQRFYHKEEMGPKRKT